MCFKHSPVPDPEGGVGDQKPGPSVECSQPHSPVNHSPEKKFIILF